MGIASTSLTIAIAIIYNIFVHHLTSMMYRDNAYEQKFSNTLTTLFVAGVAGVVIGKVFLPGSKSYNNPAVNQGFFVGGLLLIVTSLFVNWENMGEEVRLVMTGLVLGALIWFAYQYADSDNDEEDKEVEELLADAE